MSMSRRHFVGLALSASGALVLGSRLRAGESPAPPNRSPTPEKSKRPTKCRWGKVASKPRWWESELVAQAGIKDLTKRVWATLVFRNWCVTLDNGINFFDLADQYGSNPYFGRATKGVPRDKYVIQTKINSREPKAARADIERILRELNTDYYR
jgi:hypothetical protein